MAIAQAARCFGLAESLLRQWMLELSVAPVAAFPGNGPVRVDLAEIAALKQEVACLRVERDIVMIGSVFFAREPI